MTIFIQQSLLKLITFLTIVGCNSTDYFKDYKKGEITLDSGKKIEVIMAFGEEQQRKGLSGIKAEDFNDNQAMLFNSDNIKMRQFWMPETHFDLDIIFMTKDLYVLDIHRSVPHFKEAGPKYLVPLSKKVICQHVLEIKSSSPLAKEIKIGQILKWSGTKNLWQKLQGTR